jgi:SAM-dependent methyltransferase
LYTQVRAKLWQLLANRSQPVELLDVGGRKSHYTIGLPANVTVSELPRASDVQRQLHLGLDDKLAEQTRQRRSNIRAIVYDDMTRSTLPDNSFDLVVAVEVLEHVEEDEQFIRQVRRVLRPGGAFLMTTPNGTHVPNHNPDHKRHYTPDHLARVLSSSLELVGVEEAIANSVYGAWGLYGWSARRPWYTVRSMWGNWMNHRLSHPQRVKQVPEGTCHLIATGFKPAAVPQSDVPASTPLPLAFSST